MANQPVERMGPVEPEEAEVFEAMVAGLLEHIMGPARKGMADRLKKAKNPAREAGMATFDLVQLAAEQAEETGRAHDMDMLLGLAFEVAEALMELAKAAGVRVKDDENFMAEAVFSAIQSYVSTRPNDPEVQETAKAMLAEMAADGTLENGALQLQRLGQKVGVNPFAGTEVDEQSRQPGGLMGTVQ